MTLERLTTCQARGPYCLRTASQLMWSVKDRAFFVACRYCAEYEQNRGGAPSVVVQRAD